jgi:hypothetical protein
VRGCGARPEVRRWHKLLAAKWGLRHNDQLSRLTVGRILAWAMAHRRPTGRWPGRGAGPIAEAPGETWKAVQMSLVQGLCRLKGGSSLSRMLGER